MAKIMVCEVCGAEYGVRQGFKGDRFKPVHFCSEECYNKFVEAKDTTPFMLLKDYINSIYPEPELIPWDWIIKQIKSIKKVYDIDEADIRLAIKYAVEFEDYQVDQNLGLGQFIPRYLQPSQEFADSIKESRKKAKELPIVKPIHIICQPKSKPRKFKER